MLDKNAKKAIKLAVKRRDLAFEKAHSSQRDLVKIVRLTKNFTNATLEEIGVEIGVSKQRVHQMLKGE